MVFEHQLVIFSVKVCCPIAEIVMNGISAFHFCQRCDKGFGNHLQPMF